MNTEAKQWRENYQFDPFSPWWVELRQKIRQNEVVTKVIVCLWHTFELTHINTNYEKQTLEAQPIEERF